MQDEAIITAHRLGDGLTQSSIWLGDKCSWIGPTPVESGRGYVSWAHRPLGPDLYGGTSGIAMFLAELARVTGDKEVRKTALGAMRHALESVEKLNGSPLADGLYNGRTGIALAAASVADALDSDELRIEAGRLVRAVTRVANESAGFDIIRGTAGIIVGLLALRRILGTDDTVLPGALLAADRLLGQAVVPKDGTIAWYSPEQTERAPLTGFSHGAAGGGYALLELWAVTGESRFLQAAEQSFMYEDSLLERAHGNWPDLRNQGGRRSGLPSFETYWCHGAPGIALTRLRAFQLTGNLRWKSDAEIGMRTTEWIVRACLETGTGNYSLCHGLLGNCEVLALGDDLLGTCRYELLEGAIGMGAERSAKGYWLQGGTPYAVTPGLLTGAAGIGYAFLRFASSGIRSVLDLQTPDLSMSKDASFSDASYFKGTTEETRNDRFGGSTMAVDALIPPPPY